MPEELCPQQSSLDLRAVFALRHHHGSAPPMAHGTRRQYPKKWSQLSYWPQRGSRESESYHSLQAQVKELKSFVAELRQSPVQESSHSFSSLPSSAAAQSALPSGKQQHQLQVKLAQLKKWEDICTDEETKQWLDTRILEFQLQLFHGRSTALLIVSAREEAKKTQDSIERMSRHVSKVCENIEAAKARRAAVRETISHLQTKLLTESAPHESNLAPPVPPEQLLRKVWDTADEVTRSSSARLPRTTRFRMSNSWTTKRRPRIRSWSFFAKMRQRNQRVDRLQQLDS